MPPPTEQARWFAEEVHPHRSALRSYLQRSFPGVRDVDDVVQDSLLRMWTAGARRQFGCARAFLFKIARHRAVDLLRHDRASPLIAVRDLTTLSVAEDGPSPADALTTTEKVELVAEAIADLPPRCRDIVVLRKLQGLSQREVATRLGLSERTVEVQVAKGVRRCAQHLRRRGLTASGDVLTMRDGQPTPPLSPDQALDWPARTATSEAVLASVNRRVERRRQSRRRVTAIIASLALVVSAGLIWHQAAPTATSAAATATATLLQPTRQLLADGTQVELNGDAQVRVVYDAAVRRVFIVRGEAHFDVTHDPARPFVVVAGKFAVRAVGTAFAVSLASNGVNVLVTDGRVAVDRASVDPVAAPVNPIAFVSKGARVEVSPAHLAPASPGPAVVEVSATELAERLAWRVPRLEFNDTPLREAVALFNRHGSVHLSLAAPALGELRVSGVVRADNATALLQLLRADYDVEAQRHGDRDFVLSRAR